MMPRAAARPLVLALVCVAVVLTGASTVRAPAFAVAAGPVTVLVTSTSDAGLPAPVCPDAAKCTLRHAIDVANADASGDPVTIAFSPVVFPPASPATITLTATSLPEVTRANVTIDASNAGVVIDGSALPGAGVVGLALGGADGAVRGLQLHDFTGACILVSGANASVGGDSALRQGNRANACGIGIAVRGPNAAVAGNSVGFASETVTSTGILVAAANVTVGTLGPTATLGNRIGRATVAIQVGDGAGAAFTGAVVARNVIGKSDVEIAAPVVVGVLLTQPSIGTRVTQNSIANATSGIQVAADRNGVSVTGNRLQGNRFAALSRLAIDLGADGVMNVNDPGDADGGPNAGRNHPLLTRATQSRITGVADSCAGCSIELYYSLHRPGAIDGYGTDPVPVAAAITDSAGAFAFETPPVSPGQWVVAAVTDSSGNTSEFGPEIRVGSGVLQCGNVTLQRGWNHIGFFGATPVSLGNAFPSDGGKVRAIYRLTDGSTDFTRWIAGAPAGQTLTSLTPGEAYWFLADDLVSLPPGFALAVSLPVELKQGWNDFVYIGATADVRDALFSIGPFAELYRYQNTGAESGWLAYGSKDAPTWAHGFSALEACATYQIYVPQAVTLTPLQP